MSDRRTIDRRQFITAPVASVASASVAPTRAPSPTLQEDEARALAERILALSGAEGTEVSLTGGWSGNTRFAVNRVTTSGDANDVATTITARFGRRQASVRTNRFDDESLEGAVRDAERLARLAPEDPEMMPLLGPQRYMETDGWHEATARLDAERRGEVPAAAIGMAREAGGVESAGFLRVQAGGGAVANSAGLFAYHADTNVSYSTTVRTAEGRGSGWAGQGHRDWSQVDHEALSRRALEKARRSRNPRPLEPGRYTVVLEPEAVSDLLGLMNWALNARQADEGRSAFSAPGGGNLLGEQIVDERVTVRSDPEALGAPPFSGEGLPLRPITWVEGGVLRNLVYNRYWADRQGAEPTGFPSTLIMEGGEGTLEDLIAGTDRGVLVTRLWYIRSVDPRTILFTGLTRDGTFWIEDGRVTHPVNNFRWNYSPLFLLRNLEEMSRPVRVNASRIVPAIRARDFNFSSVSEAI